MACKIGINGWVWTAPFNNTSLGLLKKARKMGFDTFELPLEDPSFLDAGGRCGGLVEHLRADLDLPHLRGHVLDGLPDFRIGQSQFLGFL